MTRLVRPAARECGSGGAHRQGGNEDEQKSQTAADGWHLDPSLDAAPTDPILR
jgi:hypothetical protein